eukprot:CAMPEP_0171318012 /NCGR_PEP_ID=MMETSP0816-20121228/85018_1 /TAXON_ID=420281 /ORGANISM="Proboscia inermis, Strain CCAP1064/1" /LENGTH=45 /DNA_ID= /DNA_START= /DNA_END= /DNA_ORIENTATION=
MTRAPKVVGSDIVAVVDAPAIVSFGVDEEGIVPHLDGHTVVAQSL